ncbi:MAG: L-2-amino-thiazoline-4-carboxylic acid hydrolase [Alphaproteobacteria bacterium]
MARKPTAAELEAAVAAAHRDRALIYRAMFQALRDRLGEGAAADAMRDALRTRGRTIGESFRRFAPHDFTGFAEAFAFAPLDSKLWNATIDRCDRAGLDLTMRRCPLKEAWQAAGASDAEVAQLCHVASALDEGTFEAAGFNWSIDTWSAGEDGCCRLHVRARG